MENPTPNDNENLPTPPRRLSPTSLTASLRKKHNSLKKSLHRLFIRSDPKLFKAIQEDRWDEALHYLNNTSSDDSDNDIESLARYQIKGTSCLHCACKHPNEHSYEIISKLMTYCPNAIYQEDKWGCTPLHYAVCRINNDDVILEMLRRFPKSATLKDKEGDTALNWSLGILNKIQGSSTIFSTPYIRESFKYLFLATKMRSTTIISALLEADPSQKSILYDSCKDLLFSMISFQNWELRKELAILESGDRFLNGNGNLKDDSKHEYASDDASTVNESMASDGESKSESIIEDTYDKSIFLLKAALDYNIEKSSDENKFLALHASLRVRDCPWSIFRLFLNAHPYGKFYLIVRIIHSLYANVNIEVFQYDDEGNLPIHLLGKLILSCKNLFSLTKEIFPAIASSQPFSDGELYLCLNCNNKPKTKCYHFPYHALFK